jgi:hypothetical protein
MSPIVVRLVVVCFCCSCGRLLSNHHAEFANGAELAGSSPAGAKFADGAAGAKYLLTEPEPTICRQSQPGPNLSFWQTSSSLQL